MPGGLPSFAVFFKAVTGHVPYVWQEAAAAELVAGEPLEQVVVPTGYGKTSLMVAWLWALAVDLERVTREPGTVRKVPMRYVVVVDRRAVVDHTYTTAQRIKDTLEATTAEGSVPSGPGSEAIAAVSDVLAGLSGSGSAVEVRQLRGGMPERPENIRVPAGPAIILGTIDLVMSRLLWRGYGVAPNRRAIEAALVGTDCLFILDEAHIAAQALTTLRVLDRQALEETWFAGTVPPRQVVEMTATPRGGSAPFDFDAEFAARPELRDKQEQRRATTVQVVCGEGKTSDAALAKYAGSVPVRAGRLTLVYANTAATVKSLATALGRSTAVKQAGAQVIAVIGGMPEYARADWLGALARYRTGHPDRASAPAVVLVTNQALEVGADLDADDVVSAVCSREALIQRLGRGNRVGDRKDCTVTLVVGANGPEPVYGSAGAALAAALVEHAPSTMGELSDLLISPPAGEGEAGWDPPVPEVAVLTRHDFESYVATAGSPHEVAVGRWLRAPQEQAAEVQVAFRDALIDLVDDTAVAKHLASCPPLPGEIWTVPLPAAADLLVKASKAKRRMVLLDPAGIEPVNLAPTREDLRPGWLLVSAPIENAFGLTEAGADLISIRPATTRPFGLTPRPGHETAFLEDGQALPESGLSPADLSTLKGLARSGDVDAAAGYITGGGAPEELAPTFTAEELVDADGMGVGWVQLRRVRAQVETVPDRSVFLTEHQQAVGEQARAWAQAIGLAPRVIEDIAAAGRHHDDGKAEGIVQAELRTFIDDTGMLKSVADPNLDGSAKSMTDPSRPSVLAKSRLPRRWWPRVRAMIGIPAQYRHEAASADLFDAAVSAGEVAVHDPALVRHLVLTHHGFFRGPGPVIEHAEVPIPRYQDPNCAQWQTRTEEFAELNQRYGPYTLALAETIVRLADWQVSRDEALPKPVPDDPAGPASAHVMEVSR
ncbi:CRISPR-associated endonuclease/helicase Cas3 [Austwickia chelonae]|uniref:HD Cas3-type domain-containing protein n=1 Tax=Austwickia chelonae NBRC 105200 TaxID=1184607 RepID=K6V9J8_9MICO|nr:type I-U CRISPR-associated helicase/endonuclease Cas3 [Austwickia chelonae]GAB78908.1 hypothetical protein AUCHE_17_01200 [Austwickia chelonae NBRC 105200]SEV86303.1 CRISPR-associated endonuclease/helicase Cas3 [Austwickia chelonae]